MRLAILTLFLAATATVGCSHSDLRALEAGTVRDTSAEVVRTLRKERRMICETHERDLRNVESIYASANGLTLQQVRENPDRETLQGVERLRSRILARQDRYLREIDAEIAKYASAALPPGR